MSIDRTIHRPGYIEFSAPDFSTDGCSNAQYRRSVENITLTTIKGTITVPKDLDFLDQQGKWHSHPVIFSRYQDPDAYARNEGEVIIFLADGNYTTIPFCTKAMEKKLYQEAATYRLNEGDLRVDIKWLWPY